MSYQVEVVRKFTIAIFEKMGCSSEHAQTAADVLISADLRGVDSHGVARLSGYVRLWEKGRLNPKPNIQIVHQTPTTATIDGDLGLGLVVAPYAMQIAIEMAEKTGCGFVAVRNSNHYGIAGYHAMKALEHDMMGFSMTNASPLVSPTFSKDKLLGTNPIAVTFPAGEEPPVVIDMATTPVANGKLEVLQRKGLDTPLGWAQDADGNPSTDASILKKGGAMLPLGSDREHGSHKGYCLGGMVDIFSAVLSGANYGPWVPPFVAYLEPLDEKVGEGIGHFLGAMRVDGFRPVADFKKHMDNWIRTFRNSRVNDEAPSVLVPGDPERELTAYRTEHGLPLLPAVVEDMKQLAQKLGVEFTLE